MRQHLMDLWMPAEWKQMRRREDKNQDVHTVHSETEAEQDPLQLVGTICYVGRDTD